MAAPTVDELKKYIEPRTNGCWEWTGGVSSNGYGNFRNQGAHRVMYELIKGSIASGMQIDHLCRNKSCVNPDHLEVVTASENTRRARVGMPLTGITKTMKEMTHCGRGHEFNEDNTTYFFRLDRTGIQRRCNVCRRKK